MPTSDEPRVVVRMDWPDKITLDRYARQAGVSVAGLMREVSVLYGPAWVANRAVDKLQDRPVPKLRARNRSAP